MLNIRHHAASRAADISTFTQLLVEDVVLEPTPATDAHACGTQLLGPGVGAPSAGNPLRLRRGDVVSVLFPVRCSREGSAQLLGTLRLTWRRATGKKTAVAQLALPLGVCVFGAGGICVCACKRRCMLAKEDVCLPAVLLQTVHSTITQSHHRVKFALYHSPTVTAAAPRVTLTLEAPPMATSGTPFDLTVRAVNHTPLPQTLACTIGDSHGFLMSGGRNFVVHCLPQADAVAMWRVVAYAAGALKLPEISVNVARYSRTVVVTATRGVFVFPAAVQPAEGTTVEAPQPGVATVP